jgi:RNA polymerase sigma-70 factor (ECF subfamily)
MQDSNWLLYLDGLFRYAMILSQNRSEAEDLVQETYARAIAAIGSLREKSNERAWLFTILRNIWINQLRRRRGSPVISGVNSEEAPTRKDDRASDPHEAYVSSVEQNHVREAIAELPVHFREIIMLREFEDLSYEEIAQVLKCPVGTVMSRLARARAQLREWLSRSSLFAMQVSMRQAG